MTKKALSLSVLYLGVVCLALCQDIQTRKAYTFAPAEGGFQLDIAGRSFGPYAGLEGTPWFTVDGSAWGLVGRKPDGTTAILVNGKEKAAYKEYERCWDVTVSPDGSHWSARAGLPTDGRTRTLMIVDGKPYGTYDDVRDVVWSPDGKGWFFQAQTGTSAFVVREGRQYGPMQRASDICFDAAGRRLAMLETKAGGTWVRVDDKEYGPYESAEIARAGNGAYLGFVATSKTGTIELTIAEAKYGPYTYVDWGRSYVSADGGDWLVMVFKGSRRILLRNGKETELGRLSVYRLSKGWMYTYEKGNAQYVVFNEKQFGPFETGRNLTVTKDGSTWATSHMRTVSNVDQSFVTVNGKEYSGSAFAYVAEGAEEYFSWVSGGVDSDAIYQRFTRELSSTRLYGVAKSAGGVVVTANGKTWGPYRGIAAGPWVSPDGAHWGLLATTDDSRCRALVDGVESPAMGPYARMFDFAINNTGTGWSFTAVPDAKSPQIVRKVINGLEYGPFSYGHTTWFSKDGKGFIFWSRIEGKAGGNLLTVNGKRYGPWSYDFDPTYFDPDAATFAMVRRTNAGTLLLVNDRTYGPFQDVQVLMAGNQRDSQIGRFFGFVATLKDGRRELHVQGDKTYGPYRDIDFMRAWISETGKDWAFSVVKEGNDSQILLQNGTEQETRGIDLRRWADGYLLFVRQDGAESFSWNDGAAGPYSGVRSSWTTQDDRTWAAEVTRGDGQGQTSYVIVNGREYPGESLRYINTATAEYFTWFSTDGEKSGIASLLKIR